MKYDFPICDFEIQMMRTLWAKLSPLEIGKIKRKPYSKYIQLKLFQQMFTQSTLGVKRIF
jgi:hypothetical protein